jgi:antitoxin (DNA-binding transcriptional repressor) of toxin-antitoxin stability system
MDEVPAKRETVVITKHGKAVAKLVPFEPQTRRYLWFSSWKGEDRACARAISLRATYPNDPADRIIGATALVEGLPLG